jgi:type II secretory pathway pseudopilin PulG
MLHFFRLSRPGRGRRGHTLLQLAAAMAVAAVLAALAVPAYRGSRLKAYLSEVRQIASAWKKEAASYYLRTGSWQGATDQQTGWTFPPARWWTFLQTTYGPQGYPSEAWFRANLRPGLVSFSGLPPELQGLPDYVLVLPMDGRAPLECGRALGRTCGGRPAGGGGGGPGDGNDQPPSAPLNLRILAVDYTSITVGWDDAQNEDRYVVRWWTPGNQNSPSSSPDLAADTTAYRIDDLQPDTTYEIRVTAYNTNGGTDSNTVQGTTLPIPEATLLLRSSSGWPNFTSIVRVLRNGTMQTVCSVDEPGESGTQPAVLSQDRIATVAGSNGFYVATAPSCSGTFTPVSPDHFGIAFAFNPASDWIGVSQYFPMSGFRSIGRFRRSNISGSMEGQLAPLTTQPAIAFAAMPDGTILYYYGEDRTLRSTPSHQLIATLPEPVYDIDYHYSSGRIAWIGASSNKLYVGPLQGPWQEIPRPQPAPRSVRWHASGQMLWVQTWGPAQIWLIRDDGSPIYSWTSPVGEAYLVYPGLSW